MRALLTDHSLWEAFGSRPLATVLYGGGDIGEITSTIDRTGDGGTDRWHQEWTATASRLADIGDAAATRGHHVSAREAYLRAASYFSTA